MKWLEDVNGNKCSVEYFGSEEAAQKALDSLKDCRNCTNCSGCSGCSDCSNKNHDKGDLTPIVIPAIDAAGGKQ